MRLPGRSSLALLLVVSLADAGPPVVQTPLGAVRGRELTSFGGRRFFSFQGLPYAKPPLGSLRFKDPQPPEPWTGVLAAVEDASACTQNNLFFRSRGYEGSEDCLYLNVYTPQLRGQDGDALLPVMAWIHGGGWVSGSSNSRLYSPLFLMDRDVVLVTFNYRLGPLGFLSTGDASCRGNFGLKDQLAALRWVQDNVAAFGGDRGKVTVVGESAGGASVHYLMMSPLSKGLFQRAISQSGLAVNPWATPLPHSAAQARKLASLLRCPEEPGAALVDCLRKVPAEELIATDKHFMEWDVDPLIPFRPVVDGEVVTVHPLEHREPITIPWMTGVTKDEGALRAAVVMGDDRLLADFTGDFERVAPLTLFYHDSPHKEEISSRIKDFYFPGGNFSKAAIVDVYSDAYFMCNYDATVRKAKDHADVFYFVFSYRASRSFSRVFGPPDTDFGVCHGDELLSLFPVEFVFPLAERTAQDVASVRLVTKMWTDFARTGNPTPEDEPLHWPKVHSDALELLEIGDSLEVRGGPANARVDFWRSLPLPCSSSSSHALREEL